MELTWLFQARPRLQVPFGSNGQHLRSALPAFNITTSRNRDYPRQQESAVAQLALSFRLQDFEDVRWVLMMFVGSSRQYGSAPRKARKSLTVRSRTATHQNCPFPVSTGDNSLDGARQCLVRHAIPKTSSTVPLQRVQPGFRLKMSTVPVTLPSQSPFPFVFVGVCSSHRDLSLLTHLPKTGCPSGASRADPCQAAEFVNRRARLGEGDSP